MSALGQMQTFERASRMSALPPKADMAPTARVDHQVQKPPAAITNLSPLPPTPLNSRRPFQTLRLADVRWRTVRSGPAAYLAQLQAHATC